MRVFHFHSFGFVVPVGRGRRERTLRSLPGWAPAARAGRIALLSATLLAVAPLSGQAQWPGEIRGQVVDLLSGRGVPGALVELSASGRATRTDASGEFRIQGVDPGEHAIRASSPGYTARSKTVTARNGTVIRLRLELAPVALEVEGVQVVGRRRTEFGAIHVDREQMEGSGAQTALELLRRLPGVVVQERGPGSPATVSLRGVGADGVLVLVNGSPLNDPITGEADLSTLPVSTIGEMILIPGARSARFGPRAQGGVILISTRTGRRGFGTHGAGGSLGLGTGGAEAGFPAGGLVLDLGFDWRQQDGAFLFRRPDEIGGGEARRENADLTQGSLQAGLSGPVAAGELRTRVQIERVERGLPGKSFAPSRTARQEMERARWLAGWRRTGSGSHLDLGLSGTVQTLGHRDPKPPAGLPYDEETRLSQSVLRGDVSRTIPWDRGTVRTSAGGEADHQRVRASSLSPDMPDSRTDLGVWASSLMAWSTGPANPEASLTLRLHRDGMTRQVTGAHDITVAASPRPFTLHASHRSAFSPPGLGDQHFREGVAVAPNPELRAERIPGEWEVGVTGDVPLGAWSLSGQATAYRGDIEGMIVWSPRNVDVERRGMALQGELRHPPRGVHLSAEYSWNRVTYDRPDPVPVQVIYRPRQSGSVEVRWVPSSGWGAGLGGRYMGTRYPVPAPLNALDAFWSLDLRLHGRLDLGGWRVEPTLRIDRLGNETDSFIYGFPEPGRTWVLQVRLRSSDEFRTPNP